jgi:hypothetical protein
MGSMREFTVLMGYFMQFYHKIGFFEGFMGVREDPMGSQWGVPPLNGGSGGFGGGLTGVRGGPGGGYPPPGGGQNP